jgi:biotin/methionine sulfoxide reductase
MAMVMANYFRTLMHWGTFDIEVSDNNVVAVHGVEHDPNPSLIGDNLLGTLDDACRIKQPMVRKGYLESGPSSRKGRGSDPFVAVSWEQAETLVADELERVRQQYGNQAIYGGSYGWASAGRFHHAQSQIHRFLNCLGGYTRSVDTYSLAAGEVILPHVIGKSWALVETPTTWPSIIEHTELLVAFGGLPLKNGQISSGGVFRHQQRQYMQDAKQAGVQWVNISPLKDDAEAFMEAQWISPRPNTDVAIMLGIAHTLVEQNLHNQAYLDQYCVGYDRFLRYLIGDDDGQIKSAEWAASIAGIDATVIRDLALRMANKRTMISVSWSLTRQRYGEQPYWMGVTLAAMLGQIGLPGCGIGFGYCAENKIGAPVADVRLGSLPTGTNKVDTFIPVARIADMLLHPGEPFEYNGGSYTYPDIKLVYWAGGNPFHHHQDLGRLLTAWQKPDTTICHEISWNPTARHSDIVLPCTSALERNDIGGASGATTLLAMRQACQPVGLAKNDHDIFAAIAKRLDIDKEFTQGLSEMDWLAKLYAATKQYAQQRGVSLPKFDEFWQMGSFEYPQQKQHHVMLEAFRQNPAANPLNTPSGKIEIFSDTIERFGYNDCPGHPVWLEPEEWLGSQKVKQYPFHLVSNQPKTRLHSQLDNGITSRNSKIQQREPIRINPIDAKEKHLGNGDIVKVFNDRGALLAGVEISDQVRQGVLQMATGAWWDPLDPGEAKTLCKHGNVNVLTMDKGTSRLAQGPSALSCVVDIERWEGQPPPVSAFVAPLVEKTSR